MLYLTYFHLVTTHTHTGWQVNNYVNKTYFKIVECNIAFPLLICHQYTHTHTHTPNELYLMALNGEEICK